MSKVKNNTFELIFIIFEDIFTETRIKETIKELKVIKEFEPFFKDDDFTRIKEVFIDSQNKSDDYINIQRKNCA